MGNWFFLYSSSSSVLLIENSLFKYWGKLLLSINKLFNNCNLRIRHSNSSLSNNSGSDNFFS